mmetsp:Transcript_71187/g.200905  ORF Transcript_71187/g.200905 Transcript_71187/m.200905 type:complete len:255 (-) Transcript_71187:67-831(-)
MDGVSCSGTLVPRHEWPACGVASVRATGGDGSFGISRHDTHGDAGRRLGVRCRRGDGVVTACCLREHRCLHQSGVLGREQHPAAATAAQGRVRDATAAGGKVPPRASHGRQRVGRLSARAGGAPAREYHRRPANERLRPTRRRRARRGAPGRPGARTGNTAREVALRRGRHARGRLPRRRRRSRGRRGRRVEPRWPGRSTAAHPDVDRAALRPLGRDHGDRAALPLPRGAGPAAASFCASVARPGVHAKALPTC